MSVLCTLCEIKSSDSDDDCKVDDLPEKHTLQVNAISRIGIEELLRRDVLLLPS